MVLGHCFSRFRKERNGKEMKWNISIIRKKEEMMRERNIIDGNYPEKKSLHKRQDLWEK
jgi:hypothetical protein